MEPSPRTCMAAAITAAVMLFAQPAAASPSVWSKAAAPQLKREQDAAERADQALSEDFSLRHSQSFRRSLALKRALDALRQAGAGTSSRPATRYRLGQVLNALYDIERETELLLEAIEQMEEVARSQAPVTTRARALNSLAIGYARLGKHRDEIDAYKRALVIQPDPQSFAILLANQAEGYMAIGEILQAVRGYRASLAATTGVQMLDSGVTTLWGLAVSLDRSGDRDGALEHIRRARSYDPGDQRINGPTWFYVPAYDEDWYAALGHWQWAREDGELELENYRDAIASWRSFIARAPISDPWLPLASLRLRQCEKERDEALAKTSAPSNKK